MPLAFKSIKTFKKFKPLKILNRARTILFQKLNGLNPLNYLNDKRVVRITHSVKCRFSTSGREMLPAPSRRS